MVDTFADHYGTGGKAKAKAVKIKGEDEDGVRLQPEDQRFSVYIPSALVSWHSAVDPETRKKIKVLKCHHNGKNFEIPCDRQVEISGIAFECVRGILEQNELLDSVQEV